MRTRMPAVAGAFYPSSPKDLDRELRHLFETTPSSSSTNNVAALIVPHAGYVYSGEVAAAAYAKLYNHKIFRNIFIIGPSHQKYFNGVSIYPRGSYMTPLGEVSVNEETAMNLIQKHRFIYYDAEADVGEHCLEVQLPFLQHSLKDFQIVPLIIGNNDPSLCKKLAGALDPWLNEDNLFIISTDFSHYPSATNALIFDNETADAIVSRDAEKLRKQCDKRKRVFPANTQTALCGESAVMTLLYLTHDKQDLSFEKLLYRNSGDYVYGTKSRVVGYWAMAVNRNIPS